MRRYILLPLLAPWAAAFKDTSPFFFVSNTQLPPYPQANLALAESITTHLLSTLSSCPADDYVLVSQPGVSAADFSHPGAAPHLRASLLNGTDDGTSSTTLAIPEVVGEIDTAPLLDILERKCHASVVHANTATGTIPSESTGRRIIRVDFPVISGPASAHGHVMKLRDHDSFLHAILTTLHPRRYAVIYTTTPRTAPIPAPPTYDMDDEQQQLPLHAEFKRDVLAHSGPASAGNSTGSSGPIFERFVFLSPAMFMGLFVAFILFLILYVGLSALSSLRVSYFAFSKEMGPAAQKKAQ